MAPSFQGEEEEEKEEEKNEEERRRRRRGGGGGRGKKSRKLNLTRLRWMVMDPFASIVAVSPRSDTTLPRMRTVWLVKA